MAKNRPAGRGVSALTAAFVLASAAAAPAAPELPERHRKWLDEEIVYIITPVERDVFLKLGSERERDLFIEAFWKHRDPNPATPANEFRTEHARRIAYANGVLARGTPRAGWKTDRGRIYILLGEPNDIQRSEGRTGTVDAEIWFYQGKSDLGLPAGFNVVFYKKSGTGEFELYSPTMDGPMALLQGYMGTPDDYAEAYQRLQDIDPVLAAVSLTLIPGEESSSLGRPSLSSDLLIQRIAEVPRRQVEERYARKFLEYKDIVEVEYSANYLDSDALVKIFRDPSTGQAFVHYGLQPKRLSVGAYEGRYAATLYLNGTVKTPEGRLVYQFDKTIVLDLDEEQMKAADRRPFIIHDLFPVLAGEYELSLLLKNEVSKEFTTTEAALRVPAGGAVALASPLLGYRAEAAPPDGRLRAFRVAGVKVIPDPARIFARADRLVIATQVVGVDDAVRAGGEISFTISRVDGRPAKEWARRLAECPSLPDVVEDVDLASLPPDHYALRVAVRAGGREIVAAGEEFDLSFAQDVPRPWVYARVSPGPGDPLYLQISGAQLFNLGRFAEARTLLERAWQKTGGSEDLAFSLGRVYLAQGEPRAALPFLEAFLARPETPRYELLFLAGTAYRASGLPEKAVEALDRAVAKYGVNAALLNELGASHAALGRKDQALAAWEKSLELSPDQPAIRKAVEELKKKS